MQYANNDPVRQNDLIESATAAGVDGIAVAISSSDAFDASIWGIGTISRSRIDVKGAHLWNFSDHAVDILNQEDSRNIVGKAIREQPGKTHIFSSSDVFADPNTEFIWESLGAVRQVLCHSTVDAKAGLMSFLALARRSEDQPFTRGDADLIGILAPHLEATLQICRVSELQQQILDLAPQHMRRAVADARGVLHVAEPGFTALLLEGWPKWQGPRLPRELIELAASDLRELQQGGISVSISGVAQQLIITATRRSPVDRLTAQERAAAEAFAQGLSYKEVARRLDRSPATVRHHLRAVYAKLGVRDKGALAYAMFGRGGRVSG